MIKRLRGKFIAITAGALLALILLLLLTVNGFFIYRSLSSLDEGLDLLLTTGGADDAFHRGGIKPRLFPAGELPEELWNGISEDGNAEDGEDVFVPGFSGGRKERIFDSTDRNFRLDRSGAVVLLDHEWNLVDIIQSNEGYFDEEELSEIIESAKQSEDCDGWSGYYRYKAVDIMQYGADRKLAILNASSELSAIRSMAVISGITGLAGFAVVLLVIIIASGRAVYPMAESYEKQKRFITDAGHELKTPLTVIATNNDLAKLTFGEHEIFDTIERQSARMRTLIQNLISLAKMDEEQKPELAPFDLSEACIDTAEAFRGVAKSKGKELSYEIPDGVILNGDESKIRQLLAILLDNAVKYCDDGGKIHAELSVSGRIHFKVTNDYREVDQVALSQLFERFYRSDTARTYDGSYGLGLPIARSIASMHGGDITVKAVEHTKIRFDAAFKKISTKERI